MCEGTPETVRRHPEVRREYLGDIGMETAGESETEPALPDEAIVRVPAPRGLFRRAAPSVQADPLASELRKGTRPTRRRTDV